MVIVVSDTSPIRALAHLDLLDVLDQIFSGVLIPPAVEQELRHPPRQYARIDVAGYSFIHVQAPQDASQVQQLRQTLDPGESEALALALEVQAQAILIDEMAGRNRGTQLGLVVIGTLGILLRAKRNAIISQIAPLLDRLQSELGFYISAELRADMLLRRSRLSLVHDPRHRVRSVDRPTEGRQGKEWKAVMHHRTPRIGRTHRLPLDRANAFFSPFDELAEVYHVADPERIKRHQVAGHFSAPCCLVHYRWM